MQREEEGEIESTDASLCTSSHVLVFRPMSASPDLIDTIVFFFFNNLIYISFCNSVVLRL
jgi:hypothetical protein